MLEELYTERWGQGEPVVLLHGILEAVPGRVWQAQHSLLEYHMIAPHRRNYGQSRVIGRKPFEIDVQDTLALLGGGGHLVGFSLGAVIALLVAAQQPALIHTLTLIEPPLFTVSDAPPVREIRERLDELYDAGEAGTLTLEQFYSGFGRAHGFNPPDTLTLDEEGRHAVRATLLEPRAWSASIPFERLATLSLPTLVFTGDWFPALRIVSETIAQQLGAELVTIPGYGHYVQKSGESFNERLRAHLGTRSSVDGTSDFKVG